MVRVRTVARGEEACLEGTKRKGHPGSVCRGCRGS